MAGLRVIAFAALFSQSWALDPASSWLVYSKASGNGSRVTSVNASWIVPSYPTKRGGGNAPGWWFGIEPVPADGEQPCLVPLTRTNWVIHLITPPPYTS